MRVFDNGLRYENGMSAVLVNNDIELGFELDLDGHALNHKGTITGGVERLEK